MQFPFSNDLRVALRQHRRRPAFALTVVTTLALSIGATLAVFSVVHAVLVRALPYAEPERLVWLTSIRADNPDAPFTLPEFLDYRSRTRTLSGLAAYANWSASLAGDGVTERLQGARLSANAFDVLGVLPAAGRLLNDADDRADAPRVVLVSHRLWQRRFGGAPGAIGTSARINGEPFVIAGVLPAQFPLPLQGIDVVTPLVPDRDPLRHARSSVNFLRFFGRLAPGVDAAKAQAELTAICGALRQQFPVEYARKQGVRAVPLQEALVADFRQSLLLLFGAVIVVLGAALANLVSLALVRANERRPELTLRAALGAQRRHLARELAADALLLALLGGGLGLLLARLLIAAALPFAPAALPRLGEVSADGTALGLAAAITLSVTALLGAVPLAATLRTRAGDVLRSSGRGALGARWNQRVRNALVVGEISAALVLLLATSVLFQHLLRLRELHPGFLADGVFQARVSLPPPAYRTPEDVARFYDRLSERIRRAPGVTHVGLISVAPLSGLLATVPFVVAGELPGDGRDKTMANLRAITPGYLEAVGTRLLQGRGFAETDRSHTPPVALVSAALAARFFSGNAVGRVLLIDDNNSGPRPVEIAGVLEDVRHVALDTAPAFDIYIPLRQVHPDGVAFVRSNQFWMVKTAANPASLGATFARDLQAADPDAALSGAGTLREHVSAWLGPRRFNLGLFGAFALSAVLLAATGLYGLVSYAVSQRVPEIGLRMALGATEAGVRRMVLGQAARLGVVGAALGLVLAFAARPLLARLARDVRIDPALAAGAAALLVAVVLLAAWLPARRAARTPPTLALRDGA
jgi:putative ABC transport system permease protein